jgi:hypothetical protein
MFFPLVVIDNLNVNGSPIHKSKAKSPLIVYPNAPKALPFSFKEFQAIVWGCQ